MQRQISSSSNESEKGGDSKNGKDKKMKKKSSFGSKLKFFSGLEKGNGHHHKKGKADTGASVVAVSHVDKSTPQVTTIDIEDTSLIVAAKMTEKRHQLHDEMIRNYLERAKVRFDEEQKLLRLLENEASSHHHLQQHLPRSQHPLPPRMNANHTSQIGNPLQLSQPPPAHHSELPLDSYDVPHQQRRGGNPNRYPAHAPPYSGVSHSAGSGNPPVSPTSRGQPQQPTRHQQQPVRGEPVPESFVFVNRLPNNPKHNGSSGDRHYQQQTRQPRSPGGYSPTNHFPHGMRPAPQSSNMTATDGRMSAPREDQYRARPVSEPPQRNPKSQPHNSYDVSKMQKALPRSEVNSTEARSSGDPSRSKGDVGRGAPGTKPCRSSGCAFYGTETTDYFCSKCYQTKAHQKAPAKGKRKGAFWKKWIMN